MRAVRKLTNTVLRSLSDEFERLYADSSRPSIAPEPIFVAGAFLDPFGRLFRWFVGLGMDDAVWNHAVFSKNCDQLLTSEVARQFFAEINR